MESFTRSLRKLSCSISLSLAFIGLLTTTSISRAEVPDASTETQTTSYDQSDGWSFRLAPYAWAPAISGKTGVKGVTSDVYLGIDDVLDHFNGGALLLFEARHDRWSINTDFIWSELTANSPTPRQILFTNAKLDLNEILWTETAGYTVVNNEDISLDLLAGFRLSYIDVDLKLDGAGRPPRERPSEQGQDVQSRSFSGSQTWIDPVVGARSRIPIDEKFFVQLMGDIGGFDASSASTWQALTALGYNVCSNGAVGVGYRALSYNHNRDGFLYDAIMYGPFIGGEYRF